MVSVDGFFGGLRVVDSVAAATTVADELDLAAAELREHGTVEALLCGWPSTCERVADSCLALRGLALAVLGPAYRLPGVTEASPGGAFILGWHSRRVGGSIPAATPAPKNPLTRGLWLLADDFARAASMLRERWLSVALPASLALVTDAAFELRLAVECAGAGRSLPHGVDVLTRSGAALPVRCDCPCCLDLARWCRKAGVALKRVGMFLSAHWHGVKLTFGTCFVAGVIGVVIARWSLLVAWFEHVVALGISVILVGILLIAAVGGMRPRH